MVYVYKCLRARVLPYDDCLCKLNKPCGFGK